MRKTAIWRCAIGAAALAVAGSPSPALANGLVITNVLLVSHDAGGATIDIQFDLSWSNSWRTEWTEGAAVVTNWDAAWVFVKYRQTGGDWKHVRLAAAGHTPAAGCAIQPGASGEGTNTGVFIFRSAQGSGPLSAPATRLRWHYPANGLDRTNDLGISVMGIEMVYVAEGAFYLGSGGTESGSFTAGPWSSGATTPFQVTSENALMISNAASYLWGTSASGNNTIGPTGVLAAAYSKGYAAFYCMKHEITQGQYTDFLNSLTTAQARNRYTNTTTAGFAIEKDQIGVFSCPVPDRACNHLSWADGAAYADWAGLRPMTELEFEKACRGRAAAVANEYVWGSAAAPVKTDGFNNPGTGMETATNGNCNTSGATGWRPYRAGIYATSSSSRFAAGASYWGILDLAGNLTEQMITVGNTTGRAFTGLHGDGALSDSGGANVSGWPSSAGAGRRGGDFNSAVVPFSNRATGSSGADARVYYNGWRAVRTAP